MVRLAKLEHEICFAVQIKFTVYETYPSVFIKKWLYSALPKNLKIRTFMHILSAVDLPFVMFIRLGFCHN